MTSLVATWEKGKQSGMGKLVHSNHIYEGMFQDNWPYGKGKYAFEDGIEQYGYYTMKDIVVREQGMMTLIGRKPAWQAKQLTHALIKKEYESVVDQNVGLDQNVSAEGQSQTPRHSIVDQNVDQDQKLSEEGQSQTPSHSIEYLSSLSETAPM